MLIVDSMRTIGVTDACIMGSYITRAFTQNGYDVILCGHVAISNCLFKEMSNQIESSPWLKELVEGNHRGVRPERYSMIAHEILRGGSSKDGLEN